MKDLSTIIDRLEQDREACAHAVQAFADAYRKMIAALDDMRAHADEAQAFAAKLTVPAGDAS
jgi:outer membrane murein-binding lipoprotein Lpp